MCEGKGTYLGTLLRSTTIVFVQFVFLYFIVFFCFVFQMVTIHSMGGNGLLDF